MILLHRRIMRMKKSRVKKLAKKKTTVKKTNKKADKELIMLIPVIFLLTAFMFCARAQVVAGNTHGFFWQSTAEYSADIFAYFRMHVFVLVTVLFGIYFAFSIFAGDAKVDKHKVYIPVAVYSVMVIVSYLAAEYKDVALWGFLERYEGTVTLICYMIVLVGTMNAVRSEKAVKLTLKSFMIACFVLGIWGVLQTLGLKIEKLPAFLWVPKNLVESISAMESNVKGNPVTWFFSNQNYSSFFMVFPICISAMSCIAEEDTKKKIMYAALSGLMMFCLWRAESVGGMVGFAAAVLFACVLAGPKNIIRWKKSLGLLALAGIISIGASIPSITGQVDEALSAETMLGVKKVYAEATKSEKLQFVKIDYIKTEGKDIIFSFAGNEYTVLTEDGRLDKVMKGTEEISDTNFMRVYEENVSGYDLVIVETARKNWRFIVKDNESYHVTTTGYSVKLDEVESIGFEGKEKFATNRGYIWSRTLPLLKETVLIGKGADTYAIYFPQNDFAGRYNIGYYREGRDTVVDKPHNIYLGTAVNTGVVSMLAFVSIFAMYLFESIKTFRKHEFENYKDYMGMGIAIAVAGFMVSGLVNDTTVQMMPMVYALLGIGFAINRMIKSEK